jgi:hypothetical protein
VLRLQLGLAFVGPDRLARFGGLLHLGLRLEDIETFLAGPVVADHPTASQPRRLRQKVAILPDPHVQAVVEQSREAEMLRPKQWTRLWARLRRIQTMRRARAEKPDW